METKEDPQIPGVIFKAFPCNAPKGETRWRGQAFSSPWGGCFEARFRDFETADIGGPMYVIRDGLGCKPLAGFYALCIVVAAFGVGCTTQANSLTQTTSLTWGLSPHLVGIAAAVITGLVLIGGIRSISRYMGPPM